MGSQVSPGFEQFMDLNLALEEVLDLRARLLTRNGQPAELRDRMKGEALPVA